MKNEIQRICEKFFSGECNTICFYGCGDGLEKVIELLGDITPSDHPDGYSVIKDDVLIFEHFEFDSSVGSKRKGSQQRRSEAENKRESDKIPATEDGIIIRSEISAEYTIESYKENFLQHFAKHYEEISQYKKSLMEQGIILPTSNITTLFFVEDTTILGNIYEVDSWDIPWKPVILLACDFFLDLFEQSPDLDCILCGSWIPNKYCLWYIDRSMIAAYREHVIDTSKIKLCNFSPRNLGFKKLFSNE